MKTENNKKEFYKLQNYIEKDFSKLKKEKLILFNSESGAGNITFVNSCNDTIQYTWNSYWKGTDYIEWTKRNGESFKIGFSATLTKNYLFIGLRYFYGFYLSYPQLKKPRKKGYHDPPSTYIWFTYGMGFNL